MTAFPCVLSGATSATSYSTANPRPVPRALVARGFARRNAAPYTGGRLLQPGTTYTFLDKDGPPRPNDDADASDGHAWLLVTA